MSESERRRRYRYGRVLIETARVLSSPLDDAVVFLSGAQLEMLRNVAQYLRRREAYVSEYNPGYYLTPTIANYDDILAIVADLEEALMGNPNTLWGYSGRWSQVKWKQSTGGGNTAATTTSVPAGKVYVLEHWTVMHDGGVPLDATLWIDVGAENPTLFYDPALPSDEKAFGNTRITFEAGETLSFTVEALPNDDWCLLIVRGYMMDVPE